MGKIKDLPICDRPREKAKRFGISSLSNAELLAIIIRTGGKDNSAIDIANEIIKNNNGFSNLYLSNEINFKQYKGIGENAALVLKAVFELIARYNYIEFTSNKSRINLNQLITKYSTYFNNITQEQCILIILNSQRVVKSEKVVYIGTDDSIQFSVNNILKMILSENGHSFILLHNHPSGNESPSIGDFNVTDEIIDASKKFKLKFIDHLIFGEANFFSMSKQKSYSFSESFDD